MLKMMLWPSKVFLVLVLLTSFLEVDAPKEEIEILELFAGRARLTRLAKSVGIPGHAHDINFDLDSQTHEKSAMDFNLSAGYVLLS